MWPHLQYVAMPCNSFMRPHTTPSAACSACIWALRASPELSCQPSEHTLQIISLNKGARDGLEVGHVLALHRSTLIKFDRSIGDYYMGKPKPEAVQLPEERYGLVMVFRTFDRVSYGLIMQAQRTAVPGDVAQKP